MKINNSFPVNKEQNHIKQTGKEYALYRDAARGDVWTMDYSRPVSLKRALYNVRDDKNINEGIVGEKKIINRFISDLQSNKQTQGILHKKVIKLAGYGASAAVFETADGKIIKITDGNHIPMNRPSAVFDVPVFKKGKSGKTHFYVEEKLYQHAMPVIWLDQIKNMIKQAGYKPCDLYEYDTHQIGISKDGKLYLLDAECAKYKTIFHALVDKIKRQILKRI